MATPSSFDQVIQENTSVITNYSQIENPEALTADFPQDGRYDLMLDSVCGPLTYYNQSDARWGSFLYGGKDPLSTYGCGPTVMAMVVTSLTGNQVLPTDMAAWAAANKSWAPGQGSYHRLILDSALAYGLTAAPVKDYTVQGLADALNSGHLVVALMKKGHFTQNGHFIILTRFTEEGMIKIADANQYDNSQIDWDPSLILKVPRFKRRASLDDRPSELSILAFFFIIDSRSPFLIIACLCGGPLQWSVSGQAGYSFPSQPVSQP